MSGSPRFFFKKLLNGHSLYRHKIWEFLTFDFLPIKQFGYIVEVNCGFA